MRALLLRPAAKPVLFIVGLLPFAWLVAAAVFDWLGPNPAEALIRDTGDWTLRCLCLTLAVTPLRVVTATPALARFRRMCGLYVFFYALCHALSYAWFDMGLEPADIVRDVIKRPFILVGFGALALLIPLALTSFDSAIRRLGVRRWQRLHKAVHVIGVLALLHFFWMRSGKNDFNEVYVYAVVLGVLWSWRLIRAWQDRRRRLTAAHR